MRRTADKIIPFSECKFISENLSRKSSKIVTSNGCFDVLHWGHISYLQKAKSLGDILWVGINSDSSVKSLKGPTRPLFPELIRAQQLAALECIDYVTIFSETTPLEFLKKVRPHIHVKGADYLGKDIPETHLVESWGGKMAWMDFEEGFSTTGILEALKLFTDKDRTHRG